MPVEGESAALEMLSELGSWCGAHGAGDKCAPRHDGKRGCSEEVCEEVATLLQVTAHAAGDLCPVDQDVGSSRPRAHTPSCFDDHPLEAILLEIALGHGLKSSRSWFSLVSRDVMVCWRAVAMSQA